MNVEERIELLGDVLNCWVFGLMMEYNQIHMIDLLKNYREFSSSTGYAGNVRYLLAKKKLDVLTVLSRRFSSSGCATINPKSINYLKRQNWENLNHHSKRLSDLENQVPYFLIIECQHLFPHLLIPVLLHLKHTKLQP